MEYELLEDFLDGQVTFLSISNKNIVVACSPEKTVCFDNSVREHGLSPQDPLWTGNPITFFFFFFFFFFLCILCLVKPSRRSQPLMVRVLCHRGKT